jgi:hypothetical protein
MQRNFDMLRHCFFAAVLAFAAAPAFAQTPTGGNEPLSNMPTNTGPNNTHTVWSPRLPTPAAGEDAPPAAFIKSAQAAIAAGRLGEAQEAIERAESRALDRSVRPSRAGLPSGQALVKLLAQARQLLGNGDRGGAMQTLNQAVALPAATERED